MTDAPPSRWTTPENLLRISVVVAIATIAFKTVAWAVSGSVGLLSDALESLVNLVGALFALGMVTIAKRPADDDHPYGHTKAEYFSAGFEGLLIFGAAMAILWASVERLLHPQPLDQLGWGLVLSLISTALNGGLAMVMLRAARQHRSAALEGDGRHLLTDVWTSVGVVLGLLLAMWTGWHWLDAVLGIAVALHILKEGGKLVWTSSQGLMDEAIDAETLTTIDACVRRFEAERGGAVHCDRLNTRRAGALNFIDLHLHMPGDWSLAHATRLRMELEAALLRDVPNARITVEVLPIGVQTQSEVAEQNMP
ncbi:cation diffusion facilitator family transporter [Comamonas odontotermitis]|uniref:Cation diffusion facilitator family transporter n=1 Tax=Comamonas odontotermitis TaxID=379895 RepID=A0ABR6RH94_9BURK|nr:cation diffusion facilitator family transporter [Comamonas odontotermitis]MBB6578394.1 cation diffusion facilitator family transporter [Comamonas odontotermitis]